MPWHPEIPLGGKRPLFAWVPLLACPAVLSREKPARTAGQASSGTHSTFFPGSAPDCKAMSKPSVLTTVRLTPPGRGAVATLLVEGPGAVEAVDGRFQSAGGKPLATCPPGRLVFGHFDFGGQAREEMVVRLRGPRSVEVHILRSICRLGRSRGWKHCRWSIAPIFDT